jgi:PAS domain S-box-containing protein
MPQRAPAPDPPEPVQPPEARPSPAEPPTARAALDDARRVEREHRLLMASRFPHFARGWLAVTALWILMLLVESEITGPSVVLLLGLQLATAVGVRLLQRRDPAAPWIPASTVAAVAAFGLYWLAFFILHGGTALLVETLLMAMCAAAGMIFAFGWRSELVLVLVTLGPALLAGSWLQHFMRPIESAGALTLGAVACLGFAEISFRRIRQLLVHRMAEERALGELRASEERFRLAFARTSVGMSITDVAGRPVQLNQAICAMLGYRHDELVRLSIADVTHPDDMALTREQRQRLVDGAADSVDFEKRFLRKDGGVVWGYVTVSLARNDDGTPRHFVALVQDITQRREAMEALRASEEKLRRLALGQAAIREEERKRLGFDLHDDVCQELVGIGILIESARRRLGADAAGNEDLGRGVRYLNEVVEYLRKLAHDLRPLTLRDLGLEASLRSLADGLSSTSTEVRALFPSPIPRLAEEIEVAVYRVAQEAMSNAIRHGKASRVDVTLSTRDGRLRLDVRDDGLGFDIRDGRGNLGLVSMEERALALGGQLEMRSHPGKGTTVVLDCPLAPCARPRVATSGVGS